jgi:hypothetical protein
MATTIKLPRNVSYAKLAKEVGEEQAERMMQKIFVMLHPELGKGLAPNQVDAFRRVVSGEKLTAGMSEVAASRRFYALHPGIKKIALAWADAELVALDGKPTRKTRRSKKGK